MPYLLDLADACRKSGLTVVEEPGWRTRGHGGMTGVRTIVCHHTAGARTGELPSLRIVRDGRSDLPGPLSQLMLARSGAVHVIAAGLSYHAGATFSAAQSNPWAIGIEAEHDGVSGWPPSQYAAYARLCRALIDHYGLPVDAVLMHKEIAKPAGRKIDPNFSGPDFRLAVARVAPRTPTEPVPIVPPKPKVKPVLIERPLVKGENYVRVPAMVGSASALYGKAWAAVSVQGGAQIKVLFQRGTDTDGAPAGTRSEWAGKVRNGARVWQEIPSGTEYLEGWITAAGPGFLSVEFQPK